MSYTLSLLIIICTLFLAGCLSTNTPESTPENSETITGANQDLPTTVFTGDIATGAISDEEVDAILGEIFQAIEGGLATPETTGATEPLVESNDAMPQENTLTPEDQPQTVPQNPSLQP
ncbi:MAG: hypothetical protein NZL83_02585 [Candidatus Absconditabacterales bacterium]|nr:hypothetical protein [Candidatus Absconditabacterales bacterium]